MSNLYHIKNFRKKTSFQKVSFQNNFSSIYRKPFQGSTNVYVYILSKIIINIAKTVKKKQLCMVNPDKLKFCYYNMDKPQINFVNS